MSYLPPPDGPGRQTGVTTMRTQRAPLLTRLAWLMRRFRDRHHRRVAHGVPGWSPARGAGRRSLGSRRRPSRRAGAGNVASCPGGPAPEHAPAGPCPAPGLARTAGACPVDRAGRVGTPRQSPCRGRRQSRHHGDGLDRQLGPPDGLSTAARRRGRGGGPGNRARRCCLRALAAGHGGGTCPQRAGQATARGMAGRLAGNRTTLDQPAMRRRAERVVVAGPASSAAASGASREPGWWLPARTPWWPQAKEERLSAGGNAGPHRPGAADNTHRPASGHDSRTVTPLYGEPPALPGRARTHRPCLPAFALLTRASAGRMRGRSLAARPSGASGAGMPGPDAAWWPGPAAPAAKPKDVRSCGTWSRIPGRQVGGLARAELQDGGRKRMQ